MKKIIEKLLKLFEKIRQAENIKFANKKLEKINGKYY